MESKRFQKAWEEKQLEGKPHRRRRTVRWYQAATLVLGPGLQMRWKAASRRKWERAGPWRGGVGGGLPLEGGEDAVHGAEVGLVDDAGLAVDAFGDGDVEVGLAADDFLDQGCHGERLGNTRVLEIAQKCQVDKRENSGFPSLRN